MLFPEHSILNEWLVMHIDSHYQMTLSELLIFAFMVSTAPSQTAICFKNLNAFDCGIYALRIAHKHSTTSLRSFPNVALETVQMFV